MDQIVGFVGFSLGAALASRVVSSFSGGLRPVVRGAMRLGITATDAMASTVARAGSAVAATAAEARNETRGQTPATRTPTDTAPRQIIIARD